MSQPPSEQPGRRTVLRAGLAGGALAGVLGGGLLSGCQLRVGSPSSTPTPSDSASPGAEMTDQQALQAAGVQAELMQRTYERAGAVRPDLLAELDRLRADHTAHLDALQKLDAWTPAPSESPTTGPSGSASPGSTVTPGSGSASAVPTLTRTTALSVLAQLERFVSSARLHDLERLEGPTARLVASMVASSAQHVTLLARLPGTPAKAGHG